MVTYGQAKKMLCSHLRSILLKLEKMKISCSDGWRDWITCPKCEKAMNLSDYYHPRDFGTQWGPGNYPIDSISIEGVNYEVGDENE